jgi:hypothetical protein
MSLGIPVLINQNRSYWLSSIGNDVIHSTIQVQELDASVGRFSTLFADQAEFSTLNVSTLSFQNSDVSGMYVSSIRGNTAFFSTMTLASDLSGGVGYVRFSVDASGIQVDGDPIRFDNLVYLTSTINIIQVSTLVDTDIFAQNGYFSTLSTTQTFGTNQSFISSLQGGNGTFSSLSVSSLAATDLSGDFAQNWSQYPTLTSSIIFQPAYILSNVSNKLFFAGQELTDASGGGNNWSVFPALQDVSMNNFSLRAISTLQFQDSATLTSLTGNNLFYNGQPIQYGNASNVSQWANYIAVNNVNMNTSSLSNATLLSASNLALTGSNITNGNTFTNSLGVGGTSLVSLATINSLGQLSCQDIDVGSALTGLADVNIYGATAAPGDSALYVQGGVQFDGGSVHGFSAGVLPVAGINTGRIDMLQAGFNLLHPLVGAITTGAAMSITSGGALSIAGGGYVEMNTSTLQMINTTSGNKNTTIQAGYLTIDPDIANNNSIKLFNTLGGGVEIDGGGQGSLIGFSTLQGSNFSTINLNVSTINGVPLSSIQTPANIVCSNINVSFSTVTNALYGNNMNITGNGSINFLLANNGLIVSTNIGALRVNNIQIPDNITGITNAPNPLQSRIENFSSIQSGTMSTGNLVVSTINGAPAGGGNVLAVSSIQTSSIGSYGGSFLEIVSPVRFAPLSGIDNIDSINFASGFGIPFLNIQASTIGLGTNNAKTLSFSTNQLSTGSLFASAISSLTLNTSTITTTRVNSQTAQLSSIETFSGLPLKFTNGISFNGSIGRLDNVIDINQLEAVGTLGLYGASTILMSTLNTSLTGSLSTSQISTGALRVSSINGNNTQVAFTNNLQLSTMRLYAASTTLCYWDNTTTSSNINSSGYDVVVGTSGTYKIGASYQFNNTSGADSVRYFFLKNDTPITNSASYTTVNNNSELVAYSEILEPLANGDKIQTGVYTASSDIYLSTMITGAPVPDSPAVILTMYKIDSA